MARAKSLWPKSWSMADLLEHLGNIAPDRIRMDPIPGKATEQDLIDLEAREDRLYELVDGVLVEKVMGVPESSLTLWIGFLLQSFLNQHDLGILIGESGATRLLPGLVRIPDISFISWSRLPGRRRPTEPVVGLAPDLAVEVLSPGNTPGEMGRKLKEYFLAGVVLVWMVDPRRQTVEVFTAPDRSVLLTEEQTLDGGAVLPGFSLPLRQLFEQIPPEWKTASAKPRRQSRSRRKPTD